MKKTAVIVSLAILMLGTLAACRGNGQAPAAKGAAAVATPVKVAKAVKQTISETLTYTGTFEAWQKINITPESAGKVAKIYVEEGQFVQAGQMLAELDTESIRLQLKQAEAGLAVAEANYKNMEKNKERMDRLLKEKAVSDQQYEQVKLGYDAAKAQREQAQAGLNLARHYLDVSLMKAPFAGVIASKNAEVGDVINPMMGSYAPASGVLTLVDYSRIKMVLDVSPTEVARIRKGQVAHISSSDLAGREFEGTVSLVNQTADAYSKKFRVEVTVANLDRSLRPGTFGQVALEVSTKDLVLALPQKAIIDNKYVFLAEGGKAVRREVSLGLQNKEVVEIVAGLKEGEVVIVEGNFGLSDGSPIEIR